jgi:hypothetical protein
MLLLGERQSPALAPQGAVEAASEVDLALIAPSPRELRRGGRWLERAAADAAAALGEQGFVYALLPRRKRVAARTRLRAAGLVLDPPLVQLPSGAAPRYLLPLRRGPWRSALADQVGARPRARAALRAAAAVPFGRVMLALALPTVGIVARRPGAEPLAAWVAGMGPQRRAIADAVVATSWRGAEGAIVLSCFGPRAGEPWGVAKVAPDSAIEAGHLDRLGGAARAAGARVPEVLATGQVGARPVVIQAPVSGRLAAGLLMRSPGRFGDTAGSLTEWLERWNRATVQTTSAGGHLERELLEPATELATAFPGGPAYRDRLAARCAEVAGAELALVARHNDLTMWNVLLDRRGGIGVLDWAEAEEAGIPLTDFFYAVADAASACAGYPSRLAAVRGCFCAGGARAPTVAPLQERLRASLGLAPAALELGFHACWLRHAVNEQRAGGGPGAPFLEIVRWLASRELERSP